MNFQNFKYRFFCIIIGFLFINTSFSQIKSNVFFEKTVYEKGNLNQIPDALYRFALEDSLFTADHSRNLMIGIDFSGYYQNSSITHYDAYNDQLQYLFSPFIHYSLFPGFNFYVRVNVENVRDQYLYKERTYWADDFRGHRGDFEIAKLTYENKYITVKFGRDFFMPGMYPYERLIYSSYNYPYDQLKLAFHNKWFELSTYYLSLTPLKDDGITYQRHLNGHRLSFNLKYGYIALNDIMLYGGENQTVDWMAFNPLMLLYPYRKNKKHLDGNNIMSLEFYFTYWNYYIFTEWMLDDYQADNETPGDLEPPEWGMDITLGKKQLFKNFEFKINYSKIANRTFNAPDKDYEKFIYKNYPIGHWLGNNFWEVKSSVIYENKQVIANLTYRHYETGEEALYGPFNKDYLNYPVEEGYSQPFPSGPIRQQSGFELICFYNFNQSLLFNFNTSYWFIHNINPDAFNIKIGLAYRLRFL